MCVRPRACVPARVCPCVCARGMSLSLYKGITGITGGGSFISRPEITAGEPPQSHAVRLLHCIGAIDGICCLAAARPSETTPYRTTYTKTQINTHMAVASLVALLQHGTGRSCLASDILMLEQDILKHWPMNLLNNIIHKVTRR